METFDLTIDENQRDAIVGALRLVPQDDETDLLIMMLENLERDAHNDCTR